MKLSQLRNEQGLESKLQELWIRVQKSSPQEGFRQWRQTVLRWWSSNREIRPNSRQQVDMKTGTTAGMLQLIQNGGQTDPCKYRETGEWISSRWIRGWGRIRWMKSRLLQGRWNTVWNHRRLWHETKPQACLFTTEFKMLKFRNGTF